MHPLFCVFYPCCSSRFAICTGGFPFGSIRYSIGVSGFPFSEGGFTSERNKLRVEILENQFGTVSLLEYA